MARQVFFPLRSNAKALVAGVGVEQVRRRLKLCSLVYENLLLEAGNISIQAGPGGSFQGPRPEPVRWQTPHARKVSESEGFQISMGLETTPGLPSPGPYHAVIQSQASISWKATFWPFAAEFPVGCDWMQFVRPQQHPQEIERRVSDWERRDKSNKVLAERQSVEFVRSVIIGNANRDLGTAIAGGAAVSVDAMHRSVLAARIEDIGGWKIHGFALPILFPYVPTIDWESISEIRKDPNIESYRRILEEVEEEALDEAAGGGDIERAANRAYTTKVRDASNRIDSMGAAITKQVVAVGIGLGAGLAAMPLTGPVGPILGTVPTAIGSVIKLRRIAQERRRAGWIAVDCQLEAAEKKV